MNKLTTHLFCALPLLSGSIHAAATQVNLTSLGGNPIRDNTGTELSSGVDTANGDGALIELGYFDGGSGTFSGNWIALTGPSSSNPTLVTTVGDLSSQDGTQSIPNGLFFIQVLFDDSGSPDTTASLPAGGTQLAVRFYDSTTRASSSFYNTATNANWTLKTKDSPTPSPTLVDFDSSNFAPAWEDSSNPFRTTLVVPEPSSVALLGLGSLAMILRRRR